MPFEVVFEKRINNAHVYRDALACQRRCFESSRIQVRGAADHIHVRERTTHGLLIGRKDHVGPEVPVEKRQGVVVAGAD